MTLVLSAAGKTKKLMMLSIGSLAMNAVLNILMYYLFGVEGPAIATLVTTVALGSCILWSGAKELNTNIWKLFDGGSAILFGLESVVLTCVLYMLQQRLEQMDVHYFLILIVVCGIYGVTMFCIHGKKLLRALKNVNAKTVS
jgi:O-antigen/teichoic acid export membrane protein